MRTRSVVLVGTLIVALLMASCGNSGDDNGSEEAADAGRSVRSAPGVTDDVVRVAAFGTNSNNPLGTCILDCYVDGIEAYFAYRNSEGGVHGRSLELAHVLDDELGKDQQRALELVAADDVFAAFSATLLASGWKELVGAEVPLFVWNIHPEETKGQRSIFGNVGTICLRCTRRQVPFVAQQAGAKRIASLGYGVSENSKQCVANNVESISAYSQDIGGADVVYVNDALAFGLPNGVGPEVTAMKQADVDFVTTCMDLNGMKTLAQEMERQGMADVPMEHRNTYDHRFVAAAGDLFEGDYFSLVFRPFEAEGARLATFRGWMEKTGAELTELAIYGWVNADALYQGLRRAGPEPDRAGLIDALNQLEDFTAGGLVPPIDFGRQHDAPTQADPASHGGDPDCLALVRLVKGQFRVVGDAAKPFHCWPGDTRAWSTPARLSFE